MELRKCTVDGKEAYFHQWNTFQNVIGEQLMIGGHKGGQIQYTLGLVEMADGKVKEVAPHTIKFIEKDHNGEVTEMVRTNADRIRSMTDEELAEWITEIHACVSDDKICYLGKTCEVCTLEWLKSEVGCA